MNLAERAWVVASTAHYEQKDRQGRPYIEHVKRVATAARVHGEEAEAVAWLHDVLEDTPLTTEFLRAIGFPPTVTQAVLALTRHGTLSYTDYIQQVVEDSYKSEAGRLAYLVKVCDVGDNLKRCRASDDHEALAKRYKWALETLLRGVADPE